MTPEQLHNAYTAQVSPLPRPPLPDPPACAPCSGSRGDPSPPVCPGPVAGRPLTPAHGEWYNASTRPQAPGDPVLGHGCPRQRNPPLPPFLPPAAGL